MNNVSKTIQWCRWTINPVKGLCPVGCSYCYARRMYKRYHWDETVRYDPSVFIDLNRAKPGDRIFVGSTIDLFHPLCSMWNDEIIDICAQQKALTFIFLTKCPEYLPKEWPDNCWVGASVCNDKMLDVAVDKLEDIQAKTKIISFEPLLERLTLSLDYTFYYSGVSWAIIGPQTPYSPKTAPHIEWVKEIVTAADKANIPVFLKNNLVRLLVGNKSFTEADPIFIHKDGGWYTLRQEFPERKK